MRLFLNGKAATSLIIRHALKAKTLQRPQKSDPGNTKSHRNGGFCAAGPPAGDSSISSLAKTKRWYATNPRGVPEMAQQSSSERLTSISNSICCRHGLAMSHQVLGTRTGKQQTSPVRRLRLRDMALVEMTRCGFSAARNGPVETAGK